MILVWFGLDSALRAGAVLLVDSSTLPQCKKYLISECKSSPVSEMKIITCHWETHLEHLMSKINSDLNSDI